MNQTKVINSIKLSSLLIIGTLCYVLLVLVNRGYAIDLTTTGLIYIGRSLFVLLMVSMITLYIARALDAFLTRKNILQGHALKRVIISIILTWIISISVLIFLWVLYSLIFISGSELNLYQAFIERIAVYNYQFLVALFYFNTLYVRRFQSSDSSSLSSNIDTQNVSYSERVKTKSNGKTRILETTGFVFFEIDSGVIFGHTSDGKKHMILITTLLELENQLSPVQFFRINRSEILNIRFIESYKIFRKDRLAVELKSLEKTLITSNARSSDFRKWISS